MSLLAPLVLARDVLLIPLGELDSETRAAIAGEDGDVAVTRPASRQPSVVIDAEAAALLELFRQPRTMADVVIEFSRPRRLDPDTVLTGAYPLVSRFFASRVLETAETEVVPEGPLELMPGREIGPWCVVRSVARMEDVEVVQARDAAGRWAALKVARSTTGMAGRTLAAEAEILSHLAAVAPGLAPEPWGSDGDFLALAWCPGVDLHQAAEEARVAGPANVLALLTAVAEAYGRLHAAGVHHGDIHPRNLLVDADGRVRLIDFGLATRSGSSSAAPRGGVGFYFEPEYARAILAGQSPPPATHLGELYSVATLLYEAATGRPYLDFRLGRDELLGQIVAEAPLPFSARGVAPWPALEAVLGRALSKVRAERFSSTTELAAALAELEPPAPRALPAASRRLVSFVDGLLAEAAPDGPWMSEGLPAPRVSVNYGAAGIALGLLRIAEARGDALTLARAEAWLSWAERHGDEPEGFFNPEIEITPEVVGEASPYHSPAGVAAVRARLARAVGDRAAQAAAVAAFVAASERPPAGDDLTLGRSATVLGAALMLDALPAQDDAGRSALLALGRRLLGEIWVHLESEPPISESALDNLGIAHGWAGFAYAALQWHRASGDALPSAVPRRLEELAELAEPAGRGLEWRWKLRGERLAMPGWCNGSAGHALLWALAHRLTGEPRHLELALGAAWNTWEASRHTLTTLCCGLAGRGYALLAVYRATGDERWLQRAHELARAGVARAGQDPAYRHALWKGDLGLAYLIVDLERPERAALPWFEEEGW